MPEMPKHAVLYAKLKDYKTPKNLYFLYLMNYMEGKLLQEKHCEINDLNAIRESLILTNFNNIKL